MNQVIDFSTLTWIKNELDATLKEARQSLEVHVEDSQDEAQLGFLAAHLHQVYGTLQMVELYGASLLAEEMEQVAMALADKSVIQHDDACAVLMRAILQLPDYLDRLIAGFQDIPLVLLPLLNDMRAVRGENLLSANAMFSPDLSAPLPVSLKTDADNELDLQGQARGLRHRFQLGLLGWFREKDIENSLGSMREVLDTLQAQSEDTAALRLWWVAAGLIDALTDASLEGGAAVKRLMGQVDRRIKHLIDEGEAKMVAGLENDLLQNLLFYVAQAPTGACERVTAIQLTYQLKDLLPSDDELAAARESLTGQNSDLFATVGAAIKEELSRLKDTLDIALRSGCKGNQELAPLVDSLGSLGDTLGMLSLGAARNAVVSRAKDLKDYVDNDEVPPETSLMDVASTLLFVESSVEGMGNGRSVIADDARMEDQLVSNELGQVMDVVLQEALADLRRAKEAIVAYTQEDGSKDELEPVPQWFKQVKGGLLLLNEARAGALVESITRYIESELIGGGETAEQQELDYLADAVCGLEYFLEGLKEQRMYGNSAMDAAEQGVDRLGYKVNCEAREGALGYKVNCEARQGESPLGERGSPGGEGALGEAAVPAEEEGFEFDYSMLEDDDSANSDEFTIEGQEAADPLASDNGSLPSLEELSADDSLNAEIECVEAEAEAEVEAEVEAEASITVTEEDDGLAIIGEEVDEEILEIFIEEAEEELASIQEQLPVWLGNSEDMESLGTMRRSFHTLKGSGRLMGAMRIGEFAWAFENMLNRLMDGNISSSEDMQELLKSTLDAIPELIGQIKEATPTTAPFAYMMKCADAISQGEPLPEMGGSAAVAEPEAPESSEQAEAVVEPVLEDPALPVDVLPEEVETTVSEPDLDDNVMDAMLYDIFNAETFGHLEVVRQFLVCADDSDVQVDEDLARAMHTLHGSAHMAGATAIAELSGAMERLLKHLMGAGHPLVAEGRQALHDTAVIIEEMMNNLPGEDVFPEGYEDTMARVHNLDAAIPEGSCDTVFSAEIHEGETSASCEQIEQVDSAKDAEVPSLDDYYASCDDELLEVFLEESEDNLETCESSLHRWRESSDDQEALTGLQRALHTLKGGARMADLAEIGDVAHAVESLILSIVEGRVDACGTAMDGIQRAQDALVTMLDCVRNRQAVEPADELVASLNALHQQSPLVQEPDDQGEDKADEQLPVNTDSDPYAEVDQELLEVFIEEASDIIENSEQTLQNWKHAPEDQELMSELQRELHTLKGGARMADITEIGDLAHAVESLMVKVNEGDFTVADNMFTVLERAQDVLASMVENVRNRTQLVDADEIVANLEKLRDGKKVELSAASKKLEKTAVSVAVLAETESEDRRKRTRTTQELVRVKAGLLDNMVNYAGEVSIYRSRLEQQVGAYRFNLVEMDQTVTRVREQLRKLEMETEAQVLYRYEREGEVVNEAGAGGGGEGANDEFDPLEMDRYSHMQQLSRSLVESVSDLTSIQGLLESITRESETLLLQQSRVNTELQEGLMRTRMVPFLGLAARMRRIVRQTAQELGKKAELELSGAEGEMDRTVVDRIIAPIEHMLRNAISHGIESPGQREASGKPEVGTIHITLERESSDVVLKIADDGAGISLDAVRSKAIERGLMQANTDLSDNEVLQFILETGFSTAAKVTQVAGRGVGMDVVSNEVKQLGGTLHIDSECGKGTIFTIRLPFTLALNQALLIEVGEDTYAIPLSSVEGIVRMRREDLKAHYADPSSCFEYGGYEYQVRHLGTVLGSGAPRIDSGPRRVPVLLARVGDHNVAFHVENLLGSREIVVKSVGPQISTVRGVSGATILGDGRVVMILDLAALLRGGATVLDQVQDIINQPVRTEGLTVMVVDDSITVRKVTTRVLERNDMNVITAKDGVDAVSRLQEHIPDIMLLDIEMPRMDGFELATHVRNDARLRDIPIIMITSRTGDKHRQRAMQIGVNRYLGKPFQESDLLEIIRALLEEQNIDG